MANPIDLLKNLHYPGCQCDPCREKVKAFLRAIATGYEPEGAATPPLSPGPEVAEFVCKLAVQRLELLVAAAEAGGEVLERELAAARIFLGTNQAPRPIKD